MPSSGANGRENQVIREKKNEKPPPGYPTKQTPTKKKCPCGHRSAKKGEKGFIEGCLAALCCCWICDVCF